MATSRKGRADWRHYRRVDDTLAAVTRWAEIETVVLKFGSYRGAALRLGISVQRVSELMSKLRSARREGWAEK